MTETGTTSTLAAARVSISSLHVYPLKGAAGFSPASWPVDERGLRHDRRFMLVDENGRFISQRECPPLALVRSQIMPLVASDDPRNPKSLRVSCPGGSIDLPTKVAAGEFLRVQVWDDALDAILVSNEANEMLGEHLRLKCRLVWMPDGADRLTAVKRGEPRRQLGFADAAPLLLTSEAALDDLNERMQMSGAPAIPMDRFRPNIVVRGAAAGQDDRWSSISVNGVRFRATNSCRRCKVTTIDQATGEPRGVEPLRTLATYRREEDAVTFGQHLLVDSAGTISVGDAIRVDSSGR